MDGRNSVLLCVDGGSVAKKNWLACAKRLGVAQVSFASQSLRIIMELLVAVPCCCMWRVTVLHSGKRKSLQKIIYFTRILRVSFL